MGRYLGAHEGLGLGHTVREDGSDWQDDPATEPQLDAIRRLGGYIGTPLTKGEACGIIAALDDRRA